MVIINLNWRETVDILKRLTLCTALLAIATSARATEFVFGDFLEVTPSEVIAYIDSGGDLEIRNQQGYPLLHWAAWTGEIEVARTLLGRGVDVDVVPSGGRTPLIMASWAGQPDMVAFLLGEGADPMRADEKEFTALHYWAMSGHPETLTLLLDAGSDPLARVNLPESPGHQFLPLDGVRKHNLWAVNTDAGRRLQRLTYEGTGCEGVIVLPSDKQLSILAERTLGKASRWKQIAELNGLGPDKSYRLGDCLKLPE